MDRNVLRAVGKLTDLVASSRADPAETVVYGTVESVDGGTAMVLIDGASAATPCAMGISSKPGDRVQVTIRDHSASIGGANVSAPPTDDTVANEANGVAQDAKSDASEAKSTAAESKEAADKALEETRDLVTLRIDSSRGTVFKNSEVSTVLQVRCWKKGAEITTQAALREAMGDQTARIRWWVLRMGDEDWVSLDDGDSKLSDDGFRLTLTPSDINVKCTFKAEVITD